jgi:Flp pilus assembly CpaE family ATPase
MTLVANRTGQTKELPIAQAEEALGMPIAHRLPDDPSSVNEAMNLGVPLVIGCPTSKAGSELVRLAESLLGIPPRATASSWVNSKLLPLKTVACLFGALNTPTVGLQLAK